MTADPFNLIGSVIDGRYRVERVAGQGGFGVVYRAFHLGFEAPIALKVLKLPRHWSSADRESRVVAFHREGRMLFELSRLHPAIVRAFETGTLWTGEAPTPYLSLEWLDGVSLDRELRHRRKHGLPAFALDELLLLLAGPAEGLSRAHLRGIAHCDIKPGNLFVSTGTERHTRILDFGIARLVNDDTDSKAADPAATARTTAFTPMYAAPEQWSNRLGPTGPWTDVHALALVCTELLSGRTPFRGSDSCELQAACLDSDARPTPGGLGVLLAPPVEAVFSRALAFHPRERYRDVGVFWQALCAAAEWSPSVASFTIFSSRDEHEVESRIIDHGAPASSISVGADSRATSATSSRRASSPIRMPRAAKLKRLAVPLALGLVAVSSRGRFEPASSGRVPEQASKKPATPSPQVSESELVAPTVFTSSGAGSSAFGSVAPDRPPRGAHPSPASRTAPHSVGAVSGSERPQQRRSVSRLASSQVEPVNEVHRERSESSGIDLDDPGLVRRR